MKIKHYILASIIICFLFSFTTGRNGFKEKINYSIIENDSIQNYYVLNFIDTVYNIKHSDLWECNYLKSTVKSHNKCKLLIKKEAYTGTITYQISDESKTTYFNGKYTSGYIKNGFLIKYYPNKNIMISGQYLENWKIGIWTTYYENGNIESLNFYIKGADYPVVETEFDENGNIIYYNNEQEEIEHKIKSTTR